MNFLMSEREKYIKAMKEFIEDPTFIKYEQSIWKSPNGGYPCEYGLPAAKMIDDKQECCASCPFILHIERYGSVCVGHWTWMNEELFIAYQGDILLSVIKFLAILEG